MRALELTEGQPPVSMRLADSEGVFLATSGIVTASPSLVQGEWLVAPTGKVGVARIGDVEIWIRPKLSIDRLIFLLGYARNPRGWQDVPVPVERAAELMTALAYAFARQAERAVQRGVLQGYRRTEEALPTLRGRLREADQLRRRFGLPIPLEVVFDDFTVDIPENQLLRTAALRLLRLPRLHRSVRRSLQRMATVTLDAVTVIDRSQPSPRWQPNRLNGAYHVALRLAELVLAAESFEQRRGSVAVSGFLFDMPRVFEDFVCVALREALQPHGGRVELQYRTHLDHGEQVAMRPDLAWLMNGQPIAVVDAKYKAEKPAGFPDADLYQMLAYCTALGLSEGHLVYARGNEVPARYVVRNAGVRIVCHALDLDAEPSALLAQVAELAVGVAVGCTRPA